MEEIKYEATFSSSVPCRWLFVIREDYAWVGGVEPKKNGAGKRVCVGSTHYRYFFCSGEDHNQLTLTDPEDIIRVRERIKNDPDYTEISCNDEARMLGAGFSKPVGGRDHSKHIEELKRKYGGDEDPEYSDLDRKLIAKFRQ